MTKAVLWDFDETLAHRAGGWSQMLVDLLDEESPHHGWTARGIAPHLSRGFPWHEWERPHPELANPGAWWSHLCGVLGTALGNAGVAAPLTDRVLASVPAEYTRLDRWSVFPDVVPALERLAERGWLHVVVSNHCPELPDLASNLGIARHFTAILTSAATGFEKPHPEAYALGLRAAGNPDLAWMVGDSVEADIRGAVQCGIPGVLVRRPGPGRDAIPDLRAAAELILVHS
jgi:putative hydrolase of the HAD superfamily